MAMLEGDVTPGTGFAVAEGTFVEKTDEWESKIKDLLNRRKQ